MTNHKFLKLLSIAALGAYLGLPAPASSANLTDLGCLDESCRSPDGGGTFTRSSFPLSGYVARTTLADPFLTFVLPGTNINNSTTDLDDSTELIAAPSTGAIISIGSGTLYDSGGQAIGNASRTIIYQPSGIASGNMQITTGSAQYQITVNPNFTVNTTVTSGQFSDTKCLNLSKNANTRKKDSLRNPASYARVDLAVYYTPQARIEAARAAGAADDDHNPILQSIASAIHDATKIMLRSGVPQTFRPVLIKESPDSYNGKVASIALTSLQNDPSITLERKEVGADLVSLVFWSTAPNPTRDGAASSLPDLDVRGFHQLNPRYGFSTVALQSLADNQLTHELGHNIGADIPVGDIQDVPGGTNRDARSFDYKASVPVQFATIMANNSPGPRLAVFSNRVDKCDNGTASVSTDDFQIGQVGQDNAGSIIAGLAARSATSECLPNGKDPANPNIDCHPTHVADYMPEKFRRIMFVNSQGRFATGIYPSINLAIAASQLPYTGVNGGPNTKADYDLIWVEPGIYKERVLINSKVKIRSIAGPNKTIIEGSPGAYSTVDNNNDEVIVIHGPNNTTGTNSDSSHLRPELNGFTIMNGYANYGAGGINCTGNASPLITNNIIRDNTSFSGFGAGVNFQGCGGEISNNIIVNNQITAICPVGNSCLSTYMRPATERRGGAGIYISDMCRYRPGSPLAANRIVRCPDAPLSGQLKIVRNVIYFNRITAPLGTNDLGAGIFYEQQSGSTAKSPLAMLIANNTLTANSYESTSLALNGIGLGCRSDLAVNSNNNLELINNIASGNKSVRMVGGAPMNIQSLAANLKCLGAIGAPTVGITQATTVNGNVLGDGSVGYYHPATLFNADPLGSTAYLNWAQTGSSFNPAKVRDILASGEFAFGLHLRKVSDLISTCDIGGQRQSKVIDQGLCRATQAWDDIPVKDLIGTQGLNDTYVSNMAGSNCFSSQPIDVGALERKLMSDVCIVNFRSPGVGMRTL